MRQLGLAASFLLLATACSGSATTVDSSVVVSSDPGVTIIVAPPDDVAFPIVGIDHSEAIFEGGAAIESNDGPAYELSWKWGTGSVEVSALRGGSDAFDSRTAERAVGAQESASVIIRGETAHHFVDSAGDEHRFLWLEGPAVLELRITGLGARVDDVLGSVITLDDEALIELTGGWKVDIDESAPVSIGVGSVDAYSLADPDRAIAGVVDPPSPSLEAVEGLEPHLWPWFSDRVATPADAIGDESFVRVLRDFFKDYDLLSAVRVVYPGPDLHWREAVIKVSDQQTLQVVTQLVRPEPTTVSYALPGIRESKSRPGVVYGNVVVGNRFLRLVARSTRLGGPVSFTADELLTIATELILELETPAGG